MLLPCALQGNGREALRLLGDRKLAALASDRFRALKDARDDVAGLYASVKCEATLQEGQGLAAVRQAVAAVHALLGGPAGPSRVMMAATVAATASAGV